MNRFFSQIPTNSNWLRFLNRRYLIEGRKREARYWISKRQLQLGIEKYRGSTGFIGLTVTSFKGDVFVPCSHEADAQVSRVPPAPQDPQEWVPTRSSGRMLYHRLDTPIVAKLIVPGRNGRQNVAKSDFLRDLNWSRI